jgi:predicted nucleic acid-binding protein
MPTIPGSNIILDLLYGVEPWASWSRQWYAHCADEAAMITNAVIVAEATPRILEAKDAKAAVEAFGLSYEIIPVEAAYLAGRAHLSYRERGGNKPRILPDFLIGAHASARGYRILTRDAARYRSYFPSVEIIAPDTHP